jgi:DNA polymerase-3 subunit gamma/tau
MRDAISLLDQLASSGTKITLQMALDVLGTAANQAVMDLIEALTAGEAASGLDCIHQALDAGSDPRQFARQVVDYLRSMLLVHMNNASEVDAPPEVRAQIARHAARFDTPDLLRITRLFNQAATDARSAWQPALPLEMAFIEALIPAGEASPRAEEAAPGKAAVPERSPKASGRAPARPEAPPRESAPASSDEPGEEAAETGLTLKQVTDQWKNILSRLHQQNTTTEALLRSGKLLGIKNGTVFLGFSEVLKPKMEKSEHIDLVRKVFQQVFQGEVPVQCVVYTGKTGALPPDIDSEGMVAAALRDLGGEIVDVQ